MGRFRSPSVESAIDSKLSTSIVGTRMAAGVFWVAASILFVLHLLAVRTETVNWDEFGLMAKAHEALRTGRVTGAGRPGLATLLAAPAVRGCPDAVSTVRLARYEWIGFTLLMLGGTWVLIRIVCRHAASPVLSANTGLALLTLVPVFQRWSLQVRTDQPALAASLWAGVVLLQPRRRYVPAFFAGMLLGAGYLCSQKAIYVGLLIGVLAAGDVLADGAWNRRRESRRALFFLGGALASIVIYRVGASVFFELPPTTSIRTLTAAFAGYRASIGYNVYVAMLPTLIPHAVLAVLLAWATWRQRGSRTSQGRVLVLAWAVFAAGLGVGIFHAGTFPYFWMTLGLFPAFALALGLDSVLGSFGNPRERDLFVALAFLGLLIPTLRAAVLLLEDSQEPQRLALAFLDRNFRPTDRGFHPESALFCREEPEPFPTFFSQDIAREFYGPAASGRVASFLREFRTRPVAFLVGTYRLGQFPGEIRRFWAEHYVSYRDNVFVPGRDVVGTAGSRIPFDVLVAGPYRWLPATTEGAPCLYVDGHRLPPGDPIPLGRGEHDVTFDCAAEGWLVLAIRDLPGGDDRRPFYGEAMTKENAGVRPRFP